MSNKDGFTTVETDYEELEKKIKAHRRAVAKRVIIALAIIALLIIAIELWFALRSFSSFEVRNTLEEGDKSAVTFVNFDESIVQYSSDGALCFKPGGEIAWNQAFEMADPQIDICSPYITVYDKGGTKIFIIGKDGKADEIETIMPIMTACVANQGTVAVLMNDGANYYVQLFDKDGKALAKGEFFGEQGGLPVDIAFSSDATKLAVDMVDISEGAVNTVISFYNFGSVGQTQIDNNVGTYKYEDIIVPEIEFVSEDRMLAIGDSKLLIFKGTQKPELYKEIEFEQEISDVFYNDNYVGVAYPNNDEECTTHIMAYNYKGKTVMEGDTDVSYSHIEMNANNEVCVTNDRQCEIFTIHSVRKFSCDFDSKLYQVIYEGGTANYIFVYDGYVDEVRLK